MTINGGKLCKVIFKYLKIMEHGSLLIYFWKRRQLDVSEFTKLHKYDGTIENCDKTKQKRELYDMDVHYVFLHGVFVNKSL
ncbi:hypothetical protein CR513_43959, partial [Mucuna pruriens]